MFSAERSNGLWQGELRLIWRRISRNSQTFGFCLFSIFDYNLTRFITSKYKGFLIWRYFFQHCFGGNDYFLRKPLQKANQIYPFMPHGVKDFAASRIPNPNSLSFHPNSSWREGEVRFPMLWPAARSFLSPLTCRILTNIQFGRSYTLLHTLSYLPSSILPLPRSWWRYLLRKQNLHSRT